MKNDKYKIIKTYLDEYPNVKKRTLSRIIYKDFPLLWSNEESIRKSILYLTGSSGKNKLQILNTDKYLTPEKIIKKYNLPESIEQPYEAYKIIGNKVLIFSDTHIPFHSITAIEAMFDFTVNKNITTIILNGDITDCYDLSKFDKEPNKEKANEEREKSIQFLMELKKVYPNAKIYYKFGNHEKRFLSLLKTKAVELFDFPEIRWDVLLKLSQMDIYYIPEENYIDLNSDIFIIHGHEYRNGITSPASPARTFFLRTNAITLGGHYHQVTDYSKPQINGELIASWSIGCLCDLHPQWMPLNSWGHGFAIYTKDDEKFWHVQNKRIIKGHVV